jgi:hypothetical protein
MLCSRFSAQALGAYHITNKYRRTMFVWYDLSPSSILVQIPAKSHHGLRTRSVIAFNFKRRNQPTTGVLHQGFISISIPNQHFNPIISYHSSLYLHSSHVVLHFSRLT